MEGNERADRLAKARADTAQKEGLDRGSVARPFGLVKRAIGVGMGLIWAKRAKALNKAKRRREIGGGEALPNISKALASAGLARATERTITALRVG